MKNKGAILSFISTLIIVGLIAAAALIIFRVESALSIDPVVIFSLTDHLNGEYDYTIFGLNGSIDLNKLYNFFGVTQELLPAGAKAMVEFVDISMAAGEQGVRNLLR